MPALLFEIGVEELPALALSPAMAFMKDFLNDSFDKLKLSHSDIEVFATPRRLVVMLEELAQRQADSEEEITGPSVSLAFLADGSLSETGLSFIKAKNLSLEQVYKKDSKKGPVIAALKREAGRSSKELLPGLLIEMMKKIPFKKRMRWDSSGDTFARPVTSLLCLYDGEYLKFSFANTVSGEVSKGHRFMSPAPFKVLSNEHYRKEMRERYVILSSDEREEMFLNSALSKLTAHQGILGADSELMEIVKNLAEYPFVIVGQFSKKYLEIPQEILICEMKAHQKCFAAFDASGALLPLFICSSAVLPHDEEFFAKGNERVLRARFEDGAFYFAEDRKKTLREHAKDLSNLIFERELGSLADKSARIAQVALALASRLKLSPLEISTIEQAAPLLKADLVTGVVGQFPELEGIMGSIYAKLDHEPLAVCEAIRSHYLPKAAQDALPTTKAVALLSIADKLDTLVGVIAIGKRPTGNKDPFALRRAAIGIVRMLVHWNFSLSLDELIKLALKSYGDRFKAKEAQVLAEAQDFIVQRARGVLIEDLGKENKDSAVNFADAVFAAGSDDLVDAFLRAEALLCMQGQNSQEFMSLTQAFKRASNIVIKAKQSGEILAMTKEQGEVLLLPVEQELMRSVLETKALLKEEQDYHAIFSQIAALKPKLDSFFEQVMVMVDDQKLRAARLALLNEIKHIADKVADFTHL